MTAQKERFLCHCDREITLNHGEESHLCQCGERAFSASALRQKIIDITKKQADIKAEVARLEKQLVNLRVEATGYQMELTLRERYRTGTDFKGQPLDKSPDAFWQGVWGKPRGYRTAPAEKKIPKGVVEVDL